MKNWSILIPSIFLCSSLLAASPAAGNAAGQGEPRIRAPQSSERLLDSDYWVLIRNVALPDAATGPSRHPMDIWVVGKSIHKIGESPIVMFDKDLTYNFNGTGNIAWSFTPENQHSSADRPRLAFPEEGKPANLVLVEASKTSAFQDLDNNTDFPDLDRMAERDEIRLMIENGVVTFEVLPAKRIDRFRLGTYQSSR